MEKIAISEQPVREKSITANVAAVKKRAKVLRTVSFGFIVTSFIRMRH
jgi:hypothetical protein